MNFFVKNIPRAYVCVDSRLITPALDRLTQVILARCEVATSGLDSHMAKHLLDRAEIGVARYHVAGQTMLRSMLYDGGSLQRRAEQLSHWSARHAAPASIDPDATSLL
jgi:hypothetical protein